METEPVEKPAEAGSGIIKPEYVMKDHVRSLTMQCISEHDKKRLNESNEANEEKKQKLNNKKAKKLSGMNKSRGVTYRENKESVLCPVLVDIQEGKVERQCELEKCVYMHDIQAYLEKKSPDLGEECYIYSMSGHCPRGLTCRFGRCHTTKHGCNIVNKELEETWKADKSKHTMNTLKKELQKELNKKKYNFGKSEEVVKRFEEKYLGPVDDSDIVKIRSSEKRKINWKGKLYLSPLTTVGNLPFRRICKEFGADITCGEMALAGSLLQGNLQEWALVKRHPSEDLFGVQVCGNNQHVMTRCAQVLQEQTNIDFIDINLGCPIDLICDQGSGSGLLRRHKMVGKIVECMTDILEVPLTVKTRTGISESRRNTIDLMPIFKQSGVSLVTVHGRTREQRYTRSADWDYIEKCAAAAHPMPVFGNGDILSYLDYETAFSKAPSIAGCMIGRGALIKPWIFQEIKERRNIDISSSDRLQMLKKYVNYGLEHWGSDTMGVEKTRRFLLEWLSFLHRYIPVGLLIEPPQVMNQRPPHFRGRDELETLMAGNNCADWIKISEILLGKVPEGFNFLPKHKANAWK